MQLIYRRSHSFHFSMFAEISDEQSFLEWQLLGARMGIEIEFFHGGAEKEEGVDRGEMDWVEVRVGLLASVEIG